MRDAIAVGLMMGISVGVLVGLLIADAIDRILEGWHFGDE